MYAFLKTIDIHIDKTNFTFSGASLMKQFPPQGNFLVK